MGQKLVSNHTGRHTPVGVSNGLCEHLRAPVSGLLCWCKVLVRVCVPEQKSRSGTKDRGENRTSMTRSGMRFCAGIMGIIIIIIFLNHVLYECNKMRAPRTRANYM